MSADLPLCPSCNSKQIVKNGKIHNGKQNYKCRKCDRQHRERGRGFLAISRGQFVRNPQNKIISQSTKDLIDKLLK